MEALESVAPIGVCQDVSLGIGGAEIKVPIFTVRKCNADLILGRPWEHAVGAEHINEDDGSYTVIIKSQDVNEWPNFVLKKPIMSAIVSLFDLQEKDGLETGV